MLGQHSPGQDEEPGGGAASDQEPPDDQLRCLEHDIVSLHPVSVPQHPAHLTTDDEWASTLATNLNSAFFVLRSSVRAMRKTGGGSIVLISSAAARVGLSNHEAIGAAKVGIIGLALSAAATYARHQIRVNVIAPGMVRTPLTASLTTNSAVFKASTAMHALGRIGEPSDVAAAIEWLLHPHQSWITGQVLGIDGGLSTIRPQVVH